eukprot:NODE_6565_length_557_cov_19.157480_g6147_i0.p2 GENE.NODE_6565_length_557_cov_19.157480_g6147_i0~~NODE_6565_length_557_cov_19.157480_g6147_i0.p2  ORF type:complete len:120 (+),score=22.78 NODE_6565_length_557_cov_19.157480_g6147_i0:60-419(+)
MHNRLVPVFIKKNAFNGYPLVNNGLYGRWVWFKHTILTNPYHPIGGLLKYPQMLACVGDQFIAFWPVATMLALYTFAYSKQRAAFESKLDYGAAYFCEKKDRKVEFGKFWESQEAPAAH